MLLALAEVYQLSGTQGGGGQARQERKEKEEGKACGRSCFGGAASYWLQWEPSCSPSWAQKGLPDQPHSPASTLAMLPSSACLLL